MDQVNNEKMYFDKEDIQIYINIIHTFLVIKYAKNQLQGAPELRKGPHPVRFGTTSLEYFRNSHLLICTL